MKVAAPASLHLYHHCHAELVAVCGKVVQGGYASAQVETKKCIYNMIITILK